MIYSRRQPADNWQGRSKRLHAMVNSRKDLIDAEWSDCLSRLRDARALVLRDAESFHEAATALERVGQVLRGKVEHGLNAYKETLLELATDAGASEAVEVARLFEVVKEARNMAVHEGAWARHLSSRLVDLFLILEQAITDKMNCAEDIMVRQPVVAETWHLLAHVRQALLANSFTSVPVLIGKRWHIITDQMIMRLLRSASNAAGKKAYLSTQLGVLIEEKKVVPSKAKCFPPETKLGDLAEDMDAGPALIIDGSAPTPRLLGILTSFDLL